MSNLIYLIIGSLLINFFFILYFLVFGKYSWFQFKSKFMKNPVQINVINTSGRIRSKLINASSENVLDGQQTRHTPKDSALFKQGIANYYYMEDNTEPLTFNEINGLNPEYLTDLLKQAELNGANNFLKDLVKINLFIIALAFMAAAMIGLGVFIYNTHSNTKIIIQILQSMNVTNMRI